MIDTVVEFKQSEQSEQSEQSAFINIPTDTIHHVLAFLDDDDIAESIHTGHSLYPIIRKYLHHSKRKPFYNICHTCLHPPPHCSCCVKYRCIGILYFFTFLGLVVSCIVTLFIQ